MRQTFAGMLKLGDLIQMTGSTLLVEGLQESDGDIEVWGTWTHGGITEKTPFVMTADTELTLHDIPRLVDPRPLIK